MKMSGSFVMPKRQDNEIDMSVSFRLVGAQQKLGLRIEQKHNPKNLTGWAETEGKVTRQILLSAVDHAFNNEGKPELVPEVYRLARRDIEIVLLYVAQEQPAYEFSPQ